MPLYEYHCSECDQTFEKMMRFSELDLVPECPNCHSRETQQANFHLCLAHHRRRRRYCHHILGFRLLLRRQPLPLRLILQPAVAGNRR